MRTLLIVLLVTSLVAPVSGQGTAPRQPFTIVIKAERPSVKAGTGVWVNVNLTNTSNQDIDTSANISSLTGIDPNFVFDVRDAAGNLVPKVVYEHPELADGKLIMDRLVKPKESLIEQEEVSRLHDMSRPGQYLIQVSRPVSKNKKDDVVKSNKITLAVTP